MQTNASEMNRSLLAFHTEVVRTGLSSRHLGGLVEIPGRSWRFIFLEAGSLVLNRDEGSEVIMAPAVFWLTEGDHVRAQANAGTTVGQLILSEATLSNAIGHKPEAAELRLLSGRSFRLELGSNETLLASIRRAFDLILREAHERARGFETVIEAQVRVLLVLLWRNALNPDDLRSVSANAAIVVQRFRQLVETHFRDRWNVAQYAAELGMSSDRLHAICRRELATPPLRLIHSRTAQEAEALLERSTQTLDQIAAHLGFRNTPQFSAFFKTETGHSPGAWRRAVRAQGTDQDGLQTRSYADWP